jgi:hypothetical protein
MTQKCINGVRVCVDRSETDIEWREHLAPGSGDRDAICARSIAIREPRIREARLKLDTESTVRGTYRTTSACYLARLGRVVRSPTRSSQSLYFVASFPLRACHPGQA